MRKTTMGWMAASADQCHLDRANEKGADMCGKGQSRIGRHPFAEAKGRAGEAAGTEGAFMQPLDRGMVHGKLVADGQGQGCHGDRRRQQGSEQ